MPSAPKKNPAAVALGRRNRGKRKTLTPAALEQRRKAGFKPKPKPRPEDLLAQDLDGLPPGPLGVVNDESRMS